MTLKQLTLLTGIALVFFGAPDSTAETSAPRPFRTVEPLPLQQVHWTQGFWADRFNNCQESMIPKMWDIMSGTHYKPFLKHFEIAAGLAEGGYHGARWNDGDFYKWMQAVCAVQAIAPDPVWAQRLDDIIAVIAKAQRPDGYIHTPVLVAARNGDQSAQPFADRFNFEMYNMGHLMTTACLHHRITGKDTLLKVAIKAADFLDNEFQNPTSEQARHAVCPSHYMGIIDLYRTTNNPKYLALAQRLIQMRDLVTDGGDDNQDRVPLTQQTEIVGHAVRANYLYAGIADLYAETGSDELLTTLRSVWRNLVEKKLYITGGCGALHDGASPDGSRDQKSITRVHQAYGRNYQLPNTTAHNETCANIGNVLWNWRMFLAEGRANYIDVLELALYNAVLSGVDLSGDQFFYTNTLRQENNAPVDLRWPRTRVPFFTSFCCPPNLVRTVAEIGGYAYAQSKDTLWVNLYGSNTLNTKLAPHQKIHIEQHTNYPWDGDITLTIEDSPETEFNLKLRIPGWAKSAEIQIDGTPIEADITPGTYTTITRVWKSGTTIRLNLPMPPILVEAHPLVEESRNHVAVKRGPIVYCLESPDLPTGTRIADISIPRDMPLETEFEPQLLGGTSTIIGTVTLRKPANWTGRLYREYSRPQTTPVETRFIPYYAWSNRGPSEMSVWLPLD